MSEQDALVERVGNAIHAAMGWNYDDWDTSSLPAMSRAAIAAMQAEGLEALLERVPSLIYASVRPGDTGEGWTACIQRESGNMVGITCVDAPTKGEALREAAQRVIAALGEGDDDRD